MRCQLEGVILRGVMKKIKFSFEERIKVVALGKLTNFPVL